MKGSNLPEIHLTGLEPMRTSTLSQISQVINLKPLKLSKIWLPVLFVVVSGAVLALIIFTLLAYQVLFLNRIYPGVQVDGVAVGGMTPVQARAAVGNHVKERLARPITVQAENNTWAFTAQELGLWVDVETTVNQAYAVGRDGNLLADMLTHLRLITHPQQVTPVIRHDTGPLNRALQRIAATVDDPPRNAQVIIHPNAAVEFIPARSGRRLHLDSTRDRIEAAVVGNDTGEPVAAVTQEVLPPISNAQVEAARRQVENLLSEPLVFGFATGTDAAEWRLEPETLAGMIELVEQVNGQGKTELAMKFKREAFAPYFEEFSRVIRIEPSDARLAFDDEAGRLKVLQHSRQGRALNLESTYRQLDVLEEKLKEGPNPYIELPIILIPPVVSSEDIDSLGIKELVSESTSYFKGSSQGRVNNIALSASKFNGVIVPPGQVFSFNEHLGEITKENGFDESLIIFGDRTTVGIGGGVCQVSTTAFRTAFYGGFEIVERWAHGYRVGWYETKSGPGLDATIYTPDVDFKFRNDTDYYLLIQTETDKTAGTVTFRFYSTNTGREVIVSEPEITNVVEHGPPIYEKDPTLPKGAVKQVDWAKDGMDVTVTRTVKQGDKLLHQDVIFSQYRPWRAVYKIGSQEKTPVGAP